MKSLGIFCTVARTELKEKDPAISDTALHYLNHAIKQAYALGVADGKEENQNEPVH
jgi:hypothetical protein